jgi:hypothetical protein
MADLIVDPRWQLEGSIAARFERLLDLYAPLTPLSDGTMVRDPNMGIISKEQFIELLDTPLRHSEDT